MATFPGTENNDQQLSGFDILFGSAGNDELWQVESPNGALYGGPGDDILFNDPLAGGESFGGTGSDIIDGGDFDDVLKGEAADDVVSGSSGEDAVYGGGGRDLLGGGFDNDRVFGGDGDDNRVEFITFPQFFQPEGAPIYSDPIAAGIYGAQGNDFLDGGAGNDSIDGNEGKDILIGGAGKDTLTGGSENDTFRFRNPGETGTGNKADVITDFRKDHDTLDFDGLDANTRKKSDQDFKFIGNKAFSKSPGELQYKGGIVKGDVTGDGKADFEVRLQNSPSLGKGDIDL